MFGGVVDPETGFGREPIDLPEPIDGGFKAGVVEDFGFAIVTMAVAGRDVDAALPVVAIPLPFAVVAIAPGHEAEADGFAGNVIFYGAVLPEGDLPGAVDTVTHMHVKDSIGGPGVWNFPQVGTGEVRSTVDGDG